MLLQLPRWRYTSLLPHLLPLHLLPLHRHRHRRLRRQRRLWSVLAAREVDMATMTLRSRSCEASCEAMEGSDAVG